MSSKTALESPVNKLPYDILSEIFLQCLSENPLYDAQPDTTIAPMLLCHVCSSWRTVALTCASLWSHLYVLLPILWNEPEEREEEDDGRRLMFKNKGAFLRHLEFLRWWRTNQGSVARFLRLDIHGWGSDDGDPLSSCTYLTSDTEDFLFEYLSSVHYLDVGFLHPYLIRQRLQRGLPVAFPDLHSLVISHYPLISGDVDQYMPDITMIPSQIPPTLRRLYIQIHRIPRNRHLQDWSALTHVCLDEVGMYLDTWFTLMRTLVDLQWGYFDVHISPPAIEHPPPPICILAKLSMLNLSARLTSDYHRPFSTLLQNLEFPALRTLSLASSAETWSDSRALVDVHAVLKAAPAVTQLSLGLPRHQKGFLCFANGSDLPTVIEKNVEPLLPYAASLSHLRVELRCPNESDVAILAKDYIKRFFVSKRWLDLANPLSKVRKVTIVIKAISWDVDSEFEGILKALLKWNIKKYVKAETDVSFEIASEAEQGVGNYGDAWLTWRSKG